MFRRVAAAPAAGQARRVLPWLPFERRWRDALVAAVLPVPVGASGFWEAFAAAAPPELRLGLRAAVWILALSPPWLLGRWRTFGALGPDDRDRLLTLAAGHRRYLVRQLVELLKLVACLRAFEDPALRTRLGAPT